VADETEHPALRELRRRLEDEEASYAAALESLDRLAAFPLPEETGPEVHELLGELNGLWPAAPRPDGSGLGKALDRRAFDALAPVIERQARFNAVLVRILNAHVEHGARHHARLREMSEALVRYAQRVEPVMGARDDMRAARAPTQAEQVLEVFGRRLDGLQDRLDGLLALRDRLEILSEQVRALQESLLAPGPPPQVPRPAARSVEVEDSAYTAFENRFRGSREDVRARQADYVELLREQGPVVDLGCGRGEFLDLLRAAGIEARGVEGNAHAVRECRHRGLDVLEGDLVEFLRAQDAGRLGAVFAAQVAEHLPPPVLSGLLAQAHRTLRPGGLLVLETVNPASALGFFDVFIRDLTHERPLHPETLRFLAAAAGFSEVRIQMRSPVPDDVRLHQLPGGGLPPPMVKALNENVERLNALLFAPVDYALVARR
jgi:SAM-dependent methyltransferase